TDGGWAVHGGVFECVICIPPQAAASKIGLPGPAVHGVPIKLCYVSKVLIAGDQIASGKGDHRPTDIVVEFIETGAAGPVGGVVSNELIAGVGDNSLARRGGGVVIGILGHLDF